ncbi:MAG: hypothetical protein ACI8PZ_003144 [Myxococcota bacterium]|jgi:hypothetical protein
MRPLCLFLVAFAIGCESADPKEDAPPEEICDNLEDDDLDELADCADPDCAAVCGEVCTNGTDDDLDGLIDCLDDDCDGLCPENCGDGRDNDADGDIDCDDRDCFGSCPEVCGDGFDNDGDGKVDCLDEECVDPSCAEVCTDGRDNDADALVDCDDDDCNDPSCDENCADGRDNDADGRIDCDDSDCDGACPEICDDGRDNDADGRIDCFDDECEAICDADGDGFFSADLGGDDCDDTRPDVNPDMPEICNPEGPLDDDCDGLVDDADPDVTEDSYLEWYADRDGDGYGAEDDFVYACSRPDGTAATDDDCDDADPEVGPPTLWYADGDRDGFGAGEPVDPTPTCDPPGPGLRPEWVGLDCDDLDPLSFPGADEVCEDGIDQDCDGADRRCAGNVLIYAETTTIAEEAALAAGHTVTATNDEALFVTEYDRGGWDVVVMETPTSGMEAEQIARAIDATDRGIPLIFSWWNLDADPALQDALGVSTASFDDPPELYPAFGAPPEIWDGVATPVLPTGFSWGDNGDTFTLTRGGVVLGLANAADGEPVIVLTNDGTTLVNGFLPDNFNGSPDMLQLYGNEIRVVFEGL